ncbi:MAG: hypothetical protein COA40_06025 [Aequorivita sp.]|nr:MAG: hypothetical protein COA40_06025 [Aequorivita sp.]
MASNVLSAQEYQVPKNITLESETDFKNYETEVVNAITWLENTPINQNPAQRKDVNSFLLQWMTGTPTISIELGEFQTGLTADNSDLLVMYLAGWSKFAIENPTEKENKLLCNLAGVKSVLNLYSKNVGKGIQKNKKLEKLLKMDESELKVYVQKEIN